MSVKARVSYWEKAADILDEEIIELKKKAYKAKEEGRRIVQEAYLGTAQLLVMEAKKNRSYAAKILLEEGGVDHDKDKNHTEFL